MSWLQKYRLGNFLTSSLWIVPVVCMALGAIVGRRLWELDMAHRFELLGFGLEGSKVLLGKIGDTALTLIVFMASVILIAVQVASTQLSPRAITLIYCHTPFRNAVGIFLFTYAFALTVLGRTETVPAQVSVFVATFLAMLCIATFLVVIDNVGKLLRPVAAAELLFHGGSQVIDGVYPRPFDPAARPPDPGDRAYRTGSSRQITHPGPSGVLLAVDIQGLAAMARERDGVITLLPQVGDFVAAGEPLFWLHGGASTLDDGVLTRSLAVGPERTMQQDPAFAFRILVDIAARALSPAINDPTTAVVVIDQLHRLLGMVGSRDLETGEVKDGDGRIRFVHRTPAWEDFVALALTEIRHYGAGSVQVVRRLRQLIENLVEKLPPQRVPPLEAQLAFLERAAEQQFREQEDRGLALSADAQGLGSGRAERARG